MGKGNSRRKISSSNTKEKKYRMRVVEKRDFQVGCSLKWGISLVGSSSSFDRFVFAPHLLFRLALVYSTRDVHIGPADCY